MSSLSFQNFPGEPSSDTIMDKIKERIQQTVDSLTEKKSLLERHKKQYIDLKFKLYDYERYGPNDHPELEVQMTSKAKVKARVIDPSQILVFLGCEYFVERDPKTAVEQVESKLKFVQKAIDEFDVQIREAKKTLGNIDTLVEYQEKEDAGMEIKESRGEPAGIELNEESLPFMDIREELDEDGNVITSSVKPQNQEKLKEFGESIGGTADDEADELQELLRDMAIIPEKSLSEPKIQELHEGTVREPVLPKANTNENLEHGDDHEEAPVERAMSEAVLERPYSDTIIERAVEDTIVEREMVDTIVERDIEPDESASKPAQAISNDFFDLWKEMGIVNKSSKQNESIPTPSEMDTVREEQPDIPEIESLAKSAAEFDPELPAIAQEDILQLQVIADEMEEEGYDYGSDNDDDDDEDDDDDWDFAYGEDNLVPDTYRDLFAKELERVRAENGITEKKETATYEIENGLDGKEIIEEIKKMTKPKKKKSVSFATELQIKEIENVSEFLKEDVKVSKFMRMRGGISYPKVQEAEDKETELLSNDTAEIKPAVSDIVESIPVVGDIVESVPLMSDIVERDLISESAEPPKRVSKFKSARSGSLHTTTQTPTSPQTTQDPELPKRLSKFKAHRAEYSQPPVSKPVSIPVPINIIESTPEQEYENIKAYALNDEDEEDMLNAITDSIVVYNPDDDEDDDGSSGDDDDEEEEDDGPILADNIVEKDDVDEPSYFVDDNILSKEYNDLRKRMIETYGEKQRAAEDRIILKETEGQEFEPIDEHGNPVRVSKFRQGMKK